MASESKVLVVSVDPAARDELIRLIGGAPGFIICGAASDGAGALAALEQVAPDAVVVDVAVEVVDHVQLVRTLCARLPHAAVLVLAARDDLALAEEVLRAGARGFLTRSETLDLASEVLRRILHGEIFVSQKMSSRLVKRLVDARGEGRSPASPAAAELSRRETEILRLIGQGLTTLEIAANLDLSVRAVAAQEMRLRRKLSLSGAKQLSQYAKYWVARSHQT